MRATNPDQPLPLCSLLDLRRGARAVVRGYAGRHASLTGAAAAGGAQDAVALGRRLASMGLPLGTETEVLVLRGHGPLLLRARDARIALGRDEASCIQVETVDGIQQ